ncbi:MAG: hypothetical protein DMG59_09945 [Acidobacteria bacterium]|jgi:anti-anti-sigma factor|nr:MAG: hypothetical protein DMG59_09945 [Acidobacteriota bacterium]
MSLTIELQQLGPDIAVITLTGRLVLSGDCRQLEHLAKKMLTADAHDLIFDLSRLTGIDCAGIGVLAECASAVAARGGTLCIVGARGIVQDVLAITHLNLCVECFPTVEEAVERLLLIPSSVAMSVPREVNSRPRRI